MEVKDESAPPQAMKKKNLTKEKGYRSKRQSVTIESKK